MIHEVRITDRIALRLAIAGDTDKGERTIYCEAFRPLRCRHRNDVSVFLANRDHITGIEAIKMSVVTDDGDRAIRLNCSRARSRSRGRKRLRATGDLYEVLIKRVCRLRLPVLWRVQQTKLVVLVEDAPRRANNALVNDEIRHTGRRVGRERCAAPKHRFLLYEQALPRCDGP